MSFERTHADATEGKASDAGLISTLTDATAAPVAQEAIGPRAPARHPALDALDVLVGTWSVESCGLDGAEPVTTSVTRRWLPGRHFLVQEVLDSGGDVSTEYIGFDHRRGEIRSMLFGADGPGPFCSFALDYVWDIDGDHLTIWHGDRGSPARFIGDIDRPAGVVSGRWEWPGGGYLATATRTD